MKVKELIEQLSKFDPEMDVLGEFDSDGDDFFVKVDLKKVYKGNNIDDANWEDDGKKYCIIRLDYY
jgi:hypothetical protein